MRTPSSISYFAQLNFRHWDTLFGIKQKDRLLHMYIIGKTGSGKSTLLKTLITQDIFQGRGCMLLDPHGDLVKQIHNLTPLYRKRDIVYLDLPDENLTLKYNPLQKVEYAKRSLVASGVLEVFQKLFGSAWGVRMEHILRYILLTLLDQPKASINDISRIIHDVTYRSECMSHIVNTNVKSFWLNEYPKYTKADIMPILNKVGAFLAHPVIKKVLVENPHDISLRTAMDEKKIILVNLSKGYLGEDVAHILGSLLVTSLSSSAFSRIDIDEDTRTPFFVYMDEFQSFTTLSLVNMLSELRKFKVGMILAHQYLHQLEEPIRKAILGNVGTIISFRLGTDDARYMTNEMYPVFEMEDFINLPNYHIYLKLMIDGTPSRPFSATTLESWNPTKK